MKDNPGVYHVFIHKGLFPLCLSGFTLIGVGFFLITQSLVGELLPHDIKSLDMTTAQLAVFNDGKILKFMFHDRIAFGGSLISIGILYIWLVIIPIKNGEGWSWWLFLVSSICGFGSFLTYIGYGYLDAWHLIGTLLLLPIFIIGLYYSYLEIQTSKGIQSLFIKQKTFNFKNRRNIGDTIILFIASGLILGGIIIMLVGMTMVFVPQDLEYMKIKICGLTHINAKLIPIIAHDRASFGGGLMTTGILLFFIVWCSKTNRLLWEVLSLSISIGFLTAIGVHFWISYLDFSHLFPAYAGVVIFYIGLFLTYKSSRITEH